MVEVVIIGLVNWEHKDLHMVRCDTTWNFTFLTMVLASQMCRKKAFPTPIHNPHQPEMCSCYKCKHKMRFIKHFYLYLSGFGIQYSLIFLFLTDRNRSDVLLCSPFTSSFNILLFSAYTSAFLSAWPSRIVLL